MDISFLANDLQSQPHTRVELENLCRFHSVDLKLPEGVDAWAFLMAIAGCESSFGVDCGFRFEYSYSTNSMAYKRSSLLQQGYSKWSDACAGSYGPHQILWVVAAQYGYPLTNSPAQLISGVVSIPYVVEHLNSFKKYGAMTKEQFAASYNAGPGCLKRTNLWPTSYVQKFVGLYNNLVDTNKQ